MLSPAATNNAPWSLARTLWLLAALAAVAVLRLWRLPEAGPPDYDSVRNWQVVQQLAQGNFANLFYNGSPGFLLIYVPVAALTQNFLFFQVINALLGLAGLGLFTVWVSQKATLTIIEIVGLTLLAGTSLLLTFSGRDFTMSSVSLVLFGGLLRSHFERLQRPSGRAMVQVASWMAMGLCFNYKFLFALPILAALEVVQADGVWQLRSLRWRVLIVLAQPYLLFGAAGTIAGLPWYQWLAFYFRTVVPSVANAAGRQATLHLDLLYYVQYMVSYESPLLLAGLGLAGWLVWCAWRRGRQISKQQWRLLFYLLVWASCLLAGMSLLIKAPRGLLFAYLPLAALAVLSGRRVLPGWALATVLLLAVALNIFRIQQELYAPLPSRYPQVAAWLQRHGATKIASTVGLGLAASLSPAQTLSVITDERQLAGLRRRGYEYVLLDGYWRVAGVSRFDSLRRQKKPVAAWAAPQLQRPLLFLEHSEFTGRDYDETLAASQAAAADTLPLRLYRLQ